MDIMMCGSTTLQLVTPAVPPSALDCRISLSSERNTGMQQKSRRVIGEPMGWPVTAQEIKGVYRE